MTPFALAVAALLSIPLPSGEWALARPIRRLGRLDYVQREVRIVRRAARAVGLDEALYASLIVDESGLRHGRVSRNGSSRGVAMLHTAYAPYRRAQAVCRRQPAECHYAHLYEGAVELRDRLAQCDGDEALAVARYRGGLSSTFAPREQDLRVVKNAALIRRAVGG